MLDTYASQKYLSSFPEFFRHFLLVYFAVVFVPILRDFVTRRSKY